MKLLPQISVCIERRYVARLIGLTIDAPIVMFGIGGHWRIVVRFRSTR